MFVYLTYVYMLNTIQGKIALCGEKIFKITVIISPANIAVMKCDVGVRGKTNTYLQHSLRY